jgi:NADPH-dependent 2,4-dienoyl-CoA reductase/sulfur reductase-like enzyme
MGVLAVEMAEQLSSIGKKVTLAGATGQLIPRNLNDRAAEIMEQLLADSGVRLRYREEVLAIEKRSKGGYSVSTIRESTSYDMVIACIGVAPDLALAREAGIEIGRGIRVDPRQRTSVPGIYAAGDVAEDKNGTVTQLWHAAEYQGAIAGLNAIGVERESDLRPFRMKCEVFGTYFFSIAKPKDLNGIEIDERESADHYHCFYYSDDRLSGAVMVHDKPRAKLYEQAVREQWDRARVDSEFR